MIIHADKDVENRDWNRQRFYDKYQRRKGSNPSLKS
jgi:hypothetical protein